MDHPSGSPLQVATFAPTKLLAALATELSELLADRDYVSLEDLHTVGRLSRAGRLLAQVQNPLARFDEGMVEALPPAPIAPGYIDPFIDPMDDPYGHYSSRGPSVLRAKREAQETRAKANAESPVAKALHAQLVSLLSASEITPSTLVQLGQAAEHGSELLRAVLGIPSPAVPTRPQQHPYGMSSSSETFGATAIREVVAATAKPREGLAATVSALAVAREKGLDDVARTLEARLCLEEPNTPEETD